jgi:glutathione transport system permease protein
MLNFLVKRLFGLLPTLRSWRCWCFCSCTCCRATRAAGGRPEADDATVALVRADLGLDRPLPEQFANFFVKIAHGDFGTSTRSKRPVSTRSASASCRRCC